MFAVTVKLTKRTLALLLALFLTCTVLVAGRQTLDFRVSVAGYPIDPEHPERVATLLKTLTEEPIRLHWEGKVHSLAPETLGITVHLDAALAAADALKNASFKERLRHWLRERTMVYDVPVAVTVDGQVAYQAVRRTFEGIEKVPTNPRFHVVEKRIVEGEWGRSIDVDRLVDLLRGIVLAVSDRGVKVPVRDTPPLLTASQIATWDELHVVGTAKTHFDPSQIARSGNIRLAARRLDGFIVLPDEEFSFNGATGERTAEAGYRAAPVIVDGELVQGIGGGVSQLASTTFNAALQAGMLITEYHSHSQPVPYLPVGRDATVWYGLLDLRFVNVLDMPVLVHARTGHDWVEVSILSPQPPTRHALIDTSVVETFPAPVETVYDPALAAGEVRLRSPGRPGQRLRIRQSVYEGDVLIEVRYLESLYQPRAEVWSVGPTA